MYCNSNSLSLVYIGYIYTMQPTYNPILVNHLFCFRKLFGLPNEIRSSAFQAVSVTTKANTQLLSGNGHCIEAKAWTRHFESLS